MFGWVHCYGPVVRQNKWQKGAVEEIYSPHGSQEAEREKACTVDSLLLPLLLPSGPLDDWMMPPKLGV
jgi:hypothetical protein